MNAKILGVHLERRAVVYLRQSTLKQVYENRESTTRQYALRDRAISLGWAESRVDTVDEDLGQSGSRVEGRTGYQRLGEDIAHGRVGAIFALEVSRLARSCADWHRLLDLCGLAEVVIVDEGAVYDPRDGNDRLLLGLKGTMSEAELTWIRLRLHGARLSKARRGALYLSPPIGYAWDAHSERLQLDPDEQVQRALRLLFDRFKVAGSAYGVVRYFLENGLRLPARTAGAGELRWVPPRPTRVLALLHNPAYAGAYVFGRHAQKVGLVDGKASRRIVRVATGEWRVCIPDRHPAYIPFEEFMANQRTLQDNSVNRGTDRRGGAPREGSALLQGIVLCGRCGHRMHASYPKAGFPRYNCSSPVHRGLSSSVCWSVSAPGVDTVVVDAFLDAVQPAEVDLALAVAREVDRQAGEVDGQWKLALERARYEARLAERRYKAVDPDNRVVIRSLERDWNEKLGEVERLERERDEARQQRRAVVAEEDRARIMELTRDLPQVWRSPATTVQERKNLLRLLVREVALHPVEVPRPSTRVCVLWVTGAISEFTIDLPLRGGPRASREADALIRERVAAGVPAGRIRSELLRLGMTTGEGRPWTKESVHSYCMHHDIRWLVPMPTSVKAPDRREDDGLYSIRGVAAEFGVSVHVVRYWVKLGWIQPANGRGRGRPAWFDLDEATRSRLQDAPRNLKNSGPPRRAPTASLPEM